MDSSERFIEAVKAGDTAEVELMIRSDPALARLATEHDKTALHWAAELNRAGTAARLLDAGAPIEAETSWGMTPLQWAANMGSADAGRLLIGRGAILNLWTAAGLGMLDAIESFRGPDGRLKPGAAQTRCREASPGRWVKLPPPDDDIEAISDAFYIACRNGHTEVGATLLRLGARIDFKGFFGGTALHWAAINGHRATVEFLLRHGARADLQDDRFGSTAIGWADEGGHSEIAGLLRSLTGREGP